MGWCSWLIHEMAGEKTNIHQVTYTLGGITTKTNGY